MNELAKFNHVLKKYLNDAKVLEQTHPKKSIPLWVNIVQYIVSFAKTKNCPVHLKRKLIEQADQILARVKNLQNQYEPRLPIPSGSQTALTGSVIEPQTALPEIDEITEADLLALPDVPTDEPSIHNTDPLIPKPTSSAPPPVDQKKEGLDQDKFAANLKRLEDELKKMPNSFKEIAAKNLLTTPTDANTPITLDITTAEVGSNVNEDPSKVLPNAKSNASPSFQVKGFLPFEKNPNQNTIKPTSSPNVKTPSVDNDAPKRVCFACGSAIGLKDTKCSNCGSPLS